LRFITSAEACPTKHMGLLTLASDSSAPGAIVLFRNPRTVDAVLAFHSLAPHDFQYSIRMNHTSVSNFNIKKCAKWMHTCSVAYCASAAAHVTTAPSVLWCICQPGAAYGS
jgi:hypothetical protein